MGSVCWGHDTGVVELNIRNFQGNWTGTATIHNPGVADTESLVFSAGEYMESETFNYGVGRVKITLDKYAVGFGAVDVLYKNGNSQANCEADSWHSYIGSFVCTGWVKVRLDDMGLVLLDEQEANGSASLNFTTLSGTLFDIWEVDLINLIPASDGDLLIRMSTNGGSSYDSGTNYGWNRYITSEGYDARGGDNDGATGIQIGVAYESTASGICGTIKLYNLASASLYKHLTYLITGIASDTIPYGVMGSGVYKVATAVDAFQFLFNGMNIASGVARLYGFRKL